MSKNTSITLGDHFDSYVASKVKSGRYSSVSDVIREGLRRLENDDIKMQILREKLAIGRTQAEKGEYAEDISYEAVMAELDEELEEDKNP